MTTKKRLAPSTTRQKAKARTRAAVKKADGRRAIQQALAAGPLAEEVKARWPQLRRQRAAALAVLDRHRKKLMARKGVVGLDVGLKLTNDNYLRPAQYVVRVHVAAKLGDSQLHSRAVIPKKIDGIDVDVLERRYVQGADAAGCGGQPEMRCFRDPMSGGVAVSGDQGATFGTLGVRVLKGGNSMYLTNAHVLPQAGADVWQPPAKGPNTPVGHDRVIGKASQHQQRDGDVDCALIEPTGARRFEGVVLGLPANVRCKIGVLRPADESVTEVFKVGAKTGADPTLVGIVESVNATVSVPDMTFDGQISVCGKQPGVFADCGDSGAILLRKSDIEKDLYEVVGLVHTVTADNRVAVASHFKKVAIALGLGLPAGG